jgi:hypothetical protein
MSRSYSLGISKNSETSPNQDGIVTRISTNTGNQFQMISFYNDSSVTLGFNEYYPVEYVSGSEVVNVISGNNSIDFGGIQAEWRC